MFSDLSTWNIEISHEWNILAILYFKISEISHNQVNLINSLYNRIFDRFDDLFKEKINN
jgi:hypothetical protein